MTPFKDSGRQKRRKQGDKIESNVDDQKRDGAVNGNEEESKSGAVVASFAVDDSTPSDPQLPDDTSHTTWSFDTTSRVLLAKFKGDIKAHEEEILLKMMERDDITVVSEGLIDGIDNNLFTFKAIDNEAGPISHNRFHLFEKNEQGIYS